MHTLTIIRGLPGSGKSTYAKRNFPGIFHIEADMALMKGGKYCFDFTLRSNGIRWSNQLIAMTLNRKMDLVVSNTFIKVSHFDGIVKAAKQRGYKVRVIRMCNSFENVHNIPQEVLDRMAHDIEDYEGEEIVQANNCSSSIDREKNLINALSEAADNYSTNCIYVDNFECDDCPNRGRCKAIKWRALINEEER